MLETDAVLEGRYRIQRVLGQGGMGGVYLATYLDRPVSVAIKELMVISRDAEEKAAVEHQFRVEAEMLYGLQHPNLPRMYDYFQANGSWYLVMDYIAGIPLDRLVEESGPVSEAVARHITVELVDVMAYLHGQRSPIIFRDLKPANIILRNDQHVTVIDFGIAKMATPTTTKTSTLIRSAGTTGFAAPEQYGAGTDQRSDVYSLGATMYYLLTGLTPPPSPALAVQAEELTPLEQLRPDVSVEYRQIIEYMMKLAPAERPAHMGEVSDLLARLPSTGPLELPSASPQPAEAPDAPVEEAPAAAQLAETPALMLVGPRKDRSELEQVADDASRLTLVTNSPKEAAELLTVRRPQGVVLFLTMSIAWNEVTALAARCRSNDIPFFVVATPQLGQSRLLATRLGSQLFFHLPMPADHILHYIEEVLSLQHLPTARVMAVDDDDIALAAMEAVFVVNDLEFYGVSEPTQFWKSLEEVQPDFLILDFEMPGATGLDLCRMVRSDPRWRLLPVLILTAATDRGLVNAVYEAGADDYATKPMRSEELLVRVLNRLRRHQILRRVSVPKASVDESPAVKSSPGLLHSRTSGG